jgi:DNA-binding IclR family transcriptional regulator
MTAAVAILEALREEPRDIDTLCALTGRPRTTIRSAVRRLGGRGYRIHNCAGRGRGHLAVYRLLGDSDRHIRRVCAWHGCGTVLSTYNHDELCGCHQRTRSQLEEVMG